MRHANKINSLSRTASHRKAMLSNMAVSLLQHKRIETTLAKAKVLRRYVEPLITRARTDTTHARRVVFSRLRNKEVVTELFASIVDKIGDRAGGYTRIIRIGKRKGDGAESCLIELVDFNTWLGDSSQAKGSKTRRRGKGKGQSSEKASSLSLTDGKSPAASTEQQPADALEETQESLHASETATATTETVADDVAPATDQPLPEAKLTAEPPEEPEAKPEALLEALPQALPPEENKETPEQEKET